MVASDADLSTGRGNRRGDKTWEKTAGWSKENLWVTRDPAAEDHERQRRKEIELIIQDLIRDYINHRLRQPLYQLLQGDFLCFRPHGKSCTRNSVEQCHCEGAFYCKIESLRQLT